MFKKQKPFLILFSLSISTVSVLTDNQLWTIVCLAHLNVYKHLETWQFGKGARICAFSFYLDLWYQVIIEVS